MIDLRFRMMRPANPARVWPEELPDAPADLVQLIEDAHADFDAGSIDVSKAPNDKLAAIVWWWLTSEQRGIFK